MNDHPADRLTDLIATDTETFGPDHGSAPLLAGWALVASWVDAESGEEDLTIIGAPSTSWPTIVGLLDVAHTRVRDGGVA